MIAIPTHPNRNWLVEIRVKDWIHTTARTLGYEEVSIPTDSDEFAARHLGYDQFVQRLIQQPELRARVESIVGKLEGQRTYANLFCAPDAVQLY